MPGSEAASGSGAERPGAPAPGDALIALCAARAAVLAPSGARGRVGGVAEACGRRRRAGEPLPRAPPAGRPAPGLLPLPALVSTAAIAGRGGAESAPPPKRNRPYGMRCGEVAPLAKAAARGLRPTATCSKGAGLGLPSACGVRVVGG